MGRCFLGVLILFAASAPTLHAQNAQLSGHIEDSSGASVPKAIVTVLNVDTGIRRTTLSNDEGIYAVPSLPPGLYKVSAQATGFQTVTRTDIRLEVEQSARLDFKLEVGTMEQTITVTGGVLLLNTTDASVGTVINREFVNNLPLNGRSFNTLLQLTPGVVIVPTTVTAPGQFSINGQRTNSNYFLVDGVSANFGVSPQFQLGEAGTGATQAFNSTGGTNSLVSADALQEFRVETSSFAPEFGRTPGGQVMLTTRSGTNKLQGGVFDYFRNDILDANDWFADQAHLPKAALRQNDFGGFVGGPLLLNRTFFFFSYEGARLRTPRTDVITVPSVSIRSEVPANVAPVLNAYPVPNGPTLSTDTAQFTGNYSNASASDAYSLRLDHAIGSHATLFARYNFSPSANRLRQGALTSIKNEKFRIQTLTGGANVSWSPRFAGSARFNYSRADASGYYTMDLFGGATPLNQQLLLPAPLSAATSATSVAFSNAPFLLFGGTLAKNTDTQLNYVGDLTVVTGLHQSKFGIDLNDLYLLASGGTASLNYSSTRVQDLSIGRFARMTAGVFNGTDVRFRAVSLYAQDSWTATSRLTLTYGFRWELNPAPSARNGTQLRTFDNVDNPSALTLAPTGTPLWATVKSNFAPRVGVALRLNDSGDLVLRTGGGLFYDIGAGAAGSLRNSFPNTASVSLVGQPFPLSDPSSILPVISLTPPYRSLFLFSRTLQLPRSWQWNAAIEKSFAPQSAFSATYVGQLGRRMLNQESAFHPSSLVSQFYALTRNSGTSDYHALQLQFRRAVAQRLQALANYTWSHSIDDNSSDAAAIAPLGIFNLRTERGNSSFDVRHNLSAAISYAIPGYRSQRAVAALTDHWSIHAILTARSSLPVDVLTSQVSRLIDASLNVETRPDIVPGVPFYVSKPGAPAGRVLNRTAFAIPTTARQGTLGRNAIPGYAANQLNLSIQRSLPFKEHFNTEFRADLFNVFNHPNFTNPFAELDDPAFGASQSMLNRGLGGLNPLFQIGGPRSIQLSLRLSF